jgi:hypothetical protein
MAWVDVEVSEQERKELSGGGGNWFKFAAIGDKVWGRFDAYKTREGKYGTEHNYTVTQQNGSVVSFTAPTDLHQKLQKAMRPADGTSKGGQGLTPGVGHKIAVTYTANQDTGQTSPMKVFRLQCDTSPATQAQQAAQARPAAQTQQQRPMQVRDQDILGPVDPPQTIRALPNDDIPF